MKRPRQEVTDAEIESLRGAVIMAEVETLLMDKVPYDKPYWGKISRYDSESVTMNPYFEAADYVAVGVSSTEDFGTESFIEGIGDLQKKSGNNIENLLGWVKGKEAGFTTREITFKRDDLVRLTDFTID